ncbi:Alpha/Beta hydrolase protein [Penicillium capsulatum]|uniref:Alpha/Beta hydrolase protein n=1 Tax=Penicillium capsulatum TaxID=69766 RepID=A0A9W9I087_9EURO|nr:Alpha/Beta hydrolase protein [Penicillium capsulatum]KAJ6117519.1 Alpha/Beta hydrolase protein [Penicillium capsulatum]
MLSIATILYNVYTLVTVPAKLVFIWFWNIPRSNRGNPNWSYRTATIVRISELVLQSMTAIRYRWPKSLEPGADGDRFIVLHPQKKFFSKTGSGRPQEDIYRGIVNSIPEI